MPEPVGPYGSGTVFDSAFILNWVAGCLLCVTSDLLNDEERLNAQSNYRELNRLRNRRLIPRILTCYFEIVVVRVITPHLWSLIVKSVTVVSVYCENFMTSHAHKSTRFTWMWAEMFLVFGSGTDPILLLILFFFSLGWPLQRNLRLRHFKSDRAEIWQECSSSKRASIDGVRFLIAIILPRWQPWS